MPVTFLLDLFIHERVNIVHLRKPPESLDSNQHIWFYCIMTDTLKDNGEIIESLMYLPLNPCTVDVIPPAVRGLPQTLRCRLTLKRPQAVGAILLAVIAPDGHDQLPMGALEVEALAVTIDPAHVMVIMRLSCHCCQQRQYQRHWSRIHDEEISVSALRPHSCLVSDSSESFIVQMF